MDYVTDKLKHRQ